MYDGRSNVCAPKVLAFKKHEFLKHAIQFGSDVVANILKTMYEKKSRGNITRNNVNFDEIYTPLILHSKTFGSLVCIPFTLHAVGEIQEKA